jgi:hypothetical protein
MKWVSYSICYHLKIKNVTEKNLHSSSDICWNKQGWDGCTYAVKATWKYNIKMGVRKTNFVDVTASG